MNVLVDIDHCICDSSWRDHMIGVSSWDEYHAASKDDKPIEEMVRIVNALVEVGHDVIGFTTRPEKFRQLTMRWMLDNCVNLGSIYMRRDDDFRSAVEIKIGMISELEDIIIDVVIDDREDVCKEFQKMGIVTLQVTAGRRKKNESI